MYKKGIKCFLVKIKKKKIIAFIIYLHYANYKIWFIKYQWKLIQLKKKKKKYGSLLKKINSWTINLENIREYY